MRIYQGKQFDTADSDRSVRNIRQAQSEYAVGIVNETYQRFASRQRKQEEGEAFDTFYNDLRVLSRTCNFCSKCNDSMLRDQVVEGIRNQSTKQDLLKLQNLTLQKSVDIYRAAKKASIQSQNMGTEDAQVMKVYKTNRAKEPARQKECLFCGYLHAPKHRGCPAYGKLCNACKEKDHFESKCPNKDRRAPKQRSNISKRSKCNAPQPRVHLLDTLSEDDEDEYARWMNAVKSRKKQRKDAKCLMLLDKQENYLPDRHGSNHQHTTCKVR